MNEPVEKRVAAVIPESRFTALQQELEARTRQQTAIAELGAASLTEIDCELLIAQSCALVAETLGTDYARVLEYIPEQRVLFPRFLIGSHQPIDVTEVDSESLYTFHADEPTVFDDLQSETRFDGAPVLTRLNVNSGISVCIKSWTGCFGVIGAYSIQPRRFKTYEIEFLISIANVLGAAIANKRAHEEIAHTRAALVEREHAAGIGSWSWSRGIRQWLWSDGLYSLLGIDKGEIEPTYESFVACVDAPSRARFTSMMERAFSVPGKHEISHRLVGPESMRVVKTTVETIFGPDGRPLRVIGMTRDITAMAESQEEQIRLAAMIELAAAEWRMACDAIEAMLMITDANGTILRMNEHARQMIGVSFEDAIGAILPRDREPWLTIRQLVSVAAETHLDAFGSCTTDDEQTFDVTARLLANSDLGEERVVLVARNVTADEEREQVRREGDILDAVNQTILDIVKRVRTPIQKINRSLEDDPPMARAGASELAAFLADLMELAQPLRVDTLMGSLPPMVDRAVDSVQRAALTRGVRLESRLERDVPAVVVNRVRFQRLLIELLTTFIGRANAGETIRVTLDADEWEGRPSLRFSIEIDREIFSDAELRWMLDPAVPRVSDETSMRISLAHRIAMEHGAVLTLANRPSTHSSMAVVRVVAILA